MKKPVLQVLIRGYEHRSEDGSDCEEVSLLSSATIGKMPTICTGHQLFHELCAEAAADGDQLPATIGFQVHQYTLNPFAPLLAARLCSGSKCFEFQAAKPKRERKHSSTLGSFFAGVKKLGKRRAAASKTASEPQAKRTRSTACESWNFQDVDAALKCLNSRQSLNQGLSDPNASATGAFHTADLACSSGNEDSTSNLSSSDSSDSEQSMEAKPSSSSSKASPQDKGVWTTKPMKLAEEAVLPPATVLEEKDVSRLASSHEFRQTAANSAASKAKGGKTFCNAFVGLMDAGMQTASKLACCRHCLVKIQKGCPRFGYAYSMTKFHGWLHEGCVFPHLVQEEANMDQAVSFLTEVLRDQSKPPQVLSAAQSVQRALQRSLDQDGL